MTSDTSKDLGAYYDDSANNVVFSSFVNAKNMALLTNKNGSSVATNDVLVISAATAASMIATTTATDLRKALVVPQNVTGGTPTAATKTILDNEAGWVYTHGYVPSAAVDAACSIGEYLKVGTTTKKFSPTGTIMATGAAIPAGAQAIALGLLGGAGNVAVYLLPAPSTSTSDGYVCIVDQKAQNTAGGTFTSGAWRTRDLNTEVSDVSGIASLSSNQVTLAAGTYRVLAFAPASTVNHHQARLYNITGGATLITGQSGMIHTAASATEVNAIVAGTFTVAASQALELQHQCETTATTTGFGTPCNFTTEVYSQIMFWKEQ